MPTAPPRSRPSPGVLAIVVLAAACAHDVRARFPAPPDAPTGSIALVFTSAASDVTVAVNGVLVVHDADTERIVIDDVPTGFAELSIAAGTGEKQVRVWVDSSRTTAVPLGAADDSPLSALRGLVLSLAGVALYALLR